jgi:hypothetical protein
MQLDVYTKKPAFFPSVNAEVFFEAEEAIESGELKLETLDSNLDAELDRILAMADPATSQTSNAPQPANETA